MRKAKCQCSEQNNADVFGEQCRVFSYVFLSCVTFLPDYVDYCSKLASPFELTLPYET
jgi:hypothetical protein